jgi:hypothetical protein
MRLLSLCALAAILSSSVGAAQQQPPGATRKPGRILGVFDDESGAPIPDAEVADFFTDSVARTEVHGLVELSHFQKHSDSVVVNISKAGFVDTTVVVMVGAADTIPLQVNLRHADVVLPAFVAMKLGNTPTERHLDEFESRRRAGVAEYIPRDTLAQYDDYSVIDFIHAVRRGCGIPLVIDEQGVAVTINGQGVPLSINGQRLTPTAVSRATLDRKIREFEGIEWYWKLVPLVFTEKDQKPPQCVMVLWTRIPRPGGGKR